ncbi:unnamed protein product [Pylaiella littoralis]
MRVVNVLVFHSLARLAAASAASCGIICREFAHERGDLAVCSSRDNSQIWNTTSGECQVSIDASLEIVSYMSLIFTAGVTPAVRYQIGNECWDFVPENVAVAIISNNDGFAADAFCDSHPTNSPSLGWEMRYDIKTNGYKDCASLVVLHEDYLVACTRLHADARGLATFGYMIAILVTGVLLIGLPCLSLL